METIAITIVASVLGSTGLFTFLQYLITRKDKNSGVQNRLDKLEKDSVRTQMLILMSNYPEEEREVMKLAEYYFKTLKGNWYMENIMKSWLKKNKISTPSWFIEAEKHE